MHEPLAFLGVSAIVICTPGQDTALTIRNALRGGRRGGIATARGVALGQAVWTLSAAVAAVRRRRLERTVGDVGGSTAPRVALREGLVGNLANPKMAAFFTSLLPQFGETFPALLALGLVFALLTFLWLSAYGVLVARARRVLERDPVRRAIEAVTGAVLVPLGLRLATDRR